MRGLPIMIIELYCVAILLRVVFSWLPPESRQNRFYEYLHAITEPVLKPVRGVLPQKGGFDFSPIIVFFILYLMIYFLQSIFLTTVIAPR